MTNKCVYCNSTKKTLLHYFICEICHKDMIDTNLREIHICDHCLGAAPNHCLGAKEQWD